MKISLVLRRFSFGKLTEFMPQHLEKVMTSIQGSRETIVLFKSWFCWGVSYDAITKLHFCENLCQSLWEHRVGTCCEAFLQHFISNEHWSFKQDLVPALKANSTKVWLRGIFQDSITQGDWPFSSSDLSPMDSKSGQCLNAWSVRRGTPISKSWSTPWWKQWQISQRRHCVMK